MMRSRVITALVLGVMLLLALFVAPAWVGIATIHLFLLLGAWEWAAFLRLNSSAARLAYVVLVAAALLGVEQLALRAGTPAWVLQVAVMWWLVALLWICLAPQRSSRLAAGVAGLMALVPTGLVLVRLIAQRGEGPEWALFVLLLAFAADTGALFTGRHLGRVKLAPQVSPGKTWEGALGGLLLALALAAGGAWWFEKPLWPFLALCCFAILLSVVGDLLESLLKRSVGLKDSGSLFPGHGGVLDRIDSATAATPAMGLGLMWLGVLA